MHFETRLCILRPTNLTRKLFWDFWRNYESHYARHMWEQARYFRSTYRIALIFLDRLWNKLAFNKTHTNKSGTTIEINLIDVTHASKFVTGINRDYAFLGYRAENVPPYANNEMLFRNSALENISATKCNRDWHLQKQIWKESIMSLYISLIQQTLKLSKKPREKIL